MQWFDTGRKAVQVKDSKNITEKGNALDATQANKDLEGTLAHDVYKEIAEVKKSAADGKTAVASATSAMGQATAADAAYSTMAANIRKISDDASAGAGNILTGKTAYAGGKKITGTMADNGAKTASLDCGSSYTIPAGYHNGKGKVTANSLAAQTQADAQAKDILTGKTAWVNGKKVTGISGANIELYSYNEMAGIFNEGKSFYSGGVHVGSLFNCYTNKSVATKTINGIVYSQGCYAFNVGKEKYNSIGNCAGLLLEALQGVNGDFRSYIFIEKNLADRNVETVPVMMYYPWGTGILNNAEFCSDGTLKYYWYYSSDGQGWTEAQYRLFAVTL